MEITSWLSLIWCYDPCVTAVTMLIILSLLRFINRDQYRSLSSVNDLLDIYNRSGAQLLNTRLPTFLYHPQHDLPLQSRLEALSAPFVSASSLLS